MSILDTLERKYGKYVPENLTKILLIGQGVSFVLTYIHPEYQTYVYLSGYQLFRGEIWRLVTFLFAPVSGSLLWFLIALYFFYLFGTALENRWGSFRFLVYIAISYIATILFALLFPDTPVSNVYLYTSLFVAFTHLYPDFQVLLFFIIPVRVKWLGYFAWFGLASAFLFGTLAAKVLIALSVSNYFLFFGNEIRYFLQSFYRGSSLPRKGRMLSKGKPMHMCAVCGANEIDNPDMEIRYCNTCSPATCYCGEHIKNHQHKRLVN